MLGVLGPLVVVVFALTAGSALATPAQSPDLPPGLSASDWADISGQIEAQQSPDGLAALLGASATQEAYLKASNTNASDQFGYSMAISGDTVVVGAPFEDGSAPSSGAAYVFTRSGGTWAQQAYLKASNIGTSDGFGWSVAISGDTVVVGAVYEDSGAMGVNGSQSDNSAPNSGAAYVFTRSAGGVWTQ